VLEVALRPDSIQSKRILSQFDSHCVLIDRMKISYPRTYPPGRTFLFCIPSATELIGSAIQ
jgi:hypothetical protein